MSADGPRARSAPRDGAAHATFELERFTWSTPDRLVPAGRFAGLADAPRDAAPVVIRGARVLSRLPAVPVTCFGTPGDGRSWHAALAWEQPPEPFTATVLQLPRSVALPDSAPKRRRFRRETLPVQVRDLQTQIERDREERDRAQAALQAERTVRVEDGERLRAGIAHLRAAAEEAVASKRGAVAGLKAELAQSVAERDAIRERVAPLEANARDAGVALESLAAARPSAGAPDDDAQSPLARLKTLRGALGEPS
jgi:hypothetical protein